MNLVRAIVLGLVCTALGWTVSYLLWTPHPVIQIEVYQEMRTESPKEGFEELVGYDGKLPFYWNDLVATRDYRMEVLRRLPKQADLLPAPSVNRYMEIDRRWTEQMFLSVYYAYAQSAPSAAHEKEMLMEFEAFAGAYLDVASARGVKIERIGSPIVSWRRAKSLFNILSVQGIATLVAAISASLIAGFLNEKRKRPNQITTDNSGAWPLRV